MQCGSQKKNKINCFLIFDIIFCCFFFNVRKDWTRKIKWNAFNYDVVVFAVPTIVLARGTDLYSHDLYGQHYPLIVIRNPIRFCFCTCDAPLCVRTIFSIRTQWIRTMWARLGIVNRMRLVLPFGKPFAMVENKSRAIVQSVKMRPQTGTFYCWRDRFWKYFWFAIDNWARWTYQTARNMWTSWLCHVSFYLPSRQTFRAETPTTCPKWWFQRRAIRW